MKNPHVIWASVAVVLILVAPASILIAMEKDITVLLTLAGLIAIPVLSAFGVAVYQKLDQVKEHSNGANIRQVELTQKVLEMQQLTQQQLTALAMSMTPTSVPPATEEKPADDFASEVLLRGPRSMDSRVL